MRKDDDHIEELILALAVAGAVVTLLVPFALWKSVENEPAHYERMGIKDTAKVAALMLLGTGLLAIAEEVFPELERFSLCHVGHWQLRSGVLISWFMINLTLGGVTYLTIPFWKGFTKKKARLKDQLY